MNTDSETPNSLKLLGERLSRQRQGLGLSIEEVAERTRIPLRYLQAIEEGNVGQLPEPVYVRAFVRKYGELVELDGAELNQQLQALTPTSGPVPTVQRPTEPLKEPTLRPYHAWLLYGALVLAAVGGFTYLQRQDTSADPVQTQSPPAVTSKREVAAARKPAPQPAKQGARTAGRPPAVAVPATPVAPMSAPQGASTTGQKASAQKTVTAAPGAAQSAPSGASVGTVVAQSTPSGGSAGAVATQSVPSNASVSTATAPSTPATSPAALTGLLRVSLNAQERSWVRVVGDGRTLYEGELGLGVRRDWQATRQLKVRTGNAGGISLTVNDQPLGLMGKSGQIAEREFRTTP
jgi:cytoskeletal protein RodZ